MNTVLFLWYQRAKPPSWRGTWDATYFRPACPQDLSRIQEDIPEFQKVNISEDCLYMNVFVPNVRIQWIIMTAKLVLVLIVITMTVVTFMCLDYVQIFPFDVNN